MKNTRTVTVGIPAYNEEANIKNLLMSVLAQKRNNFKLEKIIVISDSSTDKTVEIVKKLSKKHKIIKIIVGKKRKGKSARLNQLYSLNKSDIVINFDADVLLVGTSVIDKMVCGFSKGVAMVSGSNLPVKGENFVQKITASGDLLWYEVRNKYNSGNNIYNSSGCSTALLGEFARKIKHPKKVVADQQYLFHIVKSSGYKFKFVKNAKVIYRSPDNLRDYFRQSYRSLIEKYPVLDELGHNLSSEYTIPTSYKIKVIIKRISKDPVFTILSLFLAIWLRITPPKEDKLHNKGMWETVASTKKIIN